MSDLKKENPLSAGSISVPSFPPSQELFLTIVHDGQFHFDDVLVAVFYKTLFPGHKLLRTRDQKYIDGPNNIVADVGMVYNGKNRFDHHQKDCLTREITLEGVPYTIPYSASSLIWKDLGDKYLATRFPTKSPVERKMIHRLIETQVLAWHDATDNGRPKVADDITKERERQNEPKFSRAFCTKIQSFRPTYKELTVSDRDRLHEPRKPDLITQEKQNQGFSKAVGALVPVWDEIVRAAVERVDGYLEGRAPTPALVKAFNDEVAQGTIEFNIEPTLKKLEEKTADRMVEVSKVSMVDENRRPREGLIAEYENTISSFPEVLTNPDWKEHAEALKNVDPAILAQVGLSSGNYYLPSFHIAKLSKKVAALKMMVVPTPDGGWGVIPTNAFQGTRLPESWGGIEKEALREKIGPGSRANYVHPMGFVAAAEDVVSAVLMAAKAIEIGEKGVDDSDKDYYTKNLDFHRSVTEADQLAIRGLKALRDLQLPTAKRTPRITGRLTKKATIEHYLTTHPRVISHALYS